MYDSRNIEWYQIDTYLPIEPNALPIFDPRLDIPFIRLLNIILLEVPIAPRYPFMEQNISLWAHIMIVRTQNYVKKSQKY